MKTATFAKLASATLALALVLAFAVPAFAQTSTTTATTTMTSTTTPTATDVGTTTDDALTPGLPNTGAGGDAATTATVLALSGLVLAGGAVLLARRYA